MALKRLFLMATLLLTGCGDDSAKAPKLGETMPPFTLQSLTGERLSLPVADTAMVLLFWASWCAFCKAEMAAIEPVWLAHQGDGLLVAAVNAGEKTAEITKFVADLAISYPVLLDPDAAITRAYGVTGLPITFFIDRQGVVRGRILGQPDEATFRHKIEELR